MVFLDPFTPLVVLVASSSSYWCSWAKWVNLTVHTSQILAPLLTINIFRCCNSFNHWHHTALKFPPTHKKNISPPLKISYPNTYLIWSDITHRKISLWGNSEQPSKPNFKRHILLDKWIMWVFKQVCKKNQQNKVNKNEGYTTKVNN